MAAILALAVNTYRESIRSKVLVIILFFGVFTVLLSNILAAVSSVERQRIFSHFGLASLQISLVIMSIYLSSGILARELETRTIFNILSKPIARYQFILGKYLGVNLVISLLFAAFMLLLTCLLYLNSVALNGDFYLALWGIFIGLQVLLALGTFFASFSSVFFNAIFSSAIFLLGHWQDSLAYFAQQKSSTFLHSVYLFNYYFLPNFNLWNWKSFVGSTKQLSSHYLLQAHLNALFWVLLLLALGIYCFRRKNCE